MKKVFLTAFVAAAFAFGVSSCNNNQPAEETVDSAAQTEMCEHECSHHHDCTCADTTCAGQDSCCAQKKECCMNQQGCEGKKECCKKAN